MTSDDMEALLASIEGRLGRSWTDIVDWMREQHSLGDLEAAITVGDYTAVLETITTASERFAADVHAGYVTAAQKTATWLDGRADGLIRFDQTNTRAIAWARDNSAKLVQEISEEQRAVIQHALVNGAQTSANPRAVAREIRSSLGLTAYQAKIVDNYRAQLESNDPGQLAAALQRELRDGRYDRAVQKAIDGTPLAPERIDTMVDAYRRGWVTYRSDNLAQHEGLRAVHEGNEELYAQAIERGDVEADSLMCYWNHAGHGKFSRPTHVQMNRQERAYGVAFDIPGGGTIRFPGDPEAPLDETMGCRCTKSTRLVR